MFFVSGVFLAFVLVWSVVCGLIANPQTDHILTKVCLIGWFAAAVVAGLFLLRGNLQ